MKKTLLLAIISLIVNSVFAQNHAALENSFNINQAANLSGGMLYGTSDVWVLADGSMYAGNNTYGSTINYFNNININKIAKLNSVGVLDMAYHQANAGFNSSAEIEDVVQQADGKILIGGDFTSYNGTAISGIVRINLDGSIDPSFGISNYLNDVREILIQPNGKILVIGSFTAYSGISRSKMLRLNADGSLDTSFEVGSGFNSEVFTFGLQPDGKIVVAGAFSNYNGTAANRIVRLDANGTLDTTFVYGTGFNNNVNTVCIQPDGKILVGGNFGTYKGVSKLRMVRLESDGSIDASFTGSSTNNVVKIDLLSDNKILFASESTSLKKLNTDGTVDAGFALGAAIDDFWILPNDKIVLGGNFYSYQNTTVNTVTRIDSNGLIDPAFSTGIGLDYMVHTVKVQPDGKILVGGEFYTYNSTLVKNLIRLNQDGTIDTTFDIGTGFVGASINVIEVQSDGKIIVGGMFSSFNGNPANYLVRLNADGSFDTAFATISSRYVTSVALQPDGKVLVGQRGLTYIRRYNVDGTLDASFTSPTNPGYEVKAIKVLADGKILKANGPEEFSGNPSGSLVRLNANGSSDSSFTAYAYNDGVYDVDVQSDGKIIAVGNFTTVNGVPQTRIVRLNTNGTVDGTFSTGAGLNAVAYSVLVQPNGEVLVGGSFNAYNGQSSSRLVGINPDGTKNPMFNVGSGFSGTVYSIENQSDGKILVGGGFSNYNTYVAGCLVRLLGGGYYSLSGQNKLDADNNGCDASDIPFPNLKFHFDDGTDSYDFFSNVTGDYSFLLNAGNYTITPIVSPNFTVSPTSITANFPSQFSSLVQNYCLTSVDNLYNDLDVQIIPVSGASPGFNASYKIVYKNKGVQNLSGIVTFTFNDDVMDYITSSPSFTAQLANVLSWNFTNLAPQEQRSINVTFNLNSPVENPPLNSDDVLQFEATVSNLPNEATPDDNAFTLNETVTNSYDPNDKTCLEGTNVGPERIGDYVHYLIRFENNGTANAQFIRITDVIDTDKFDIATLEPLHASHHMVTRISNVNRVEFFFDNIQLPFDDANNDGYVMYKIKLKSNLVLGDSFSNTAGIYFDFNPPIVTNTATTTISLLGNPDFVANAITLYPNPVQDILNISQTNTEVIKSISIFNLLGQKLQYVPMGSNQNAIDVSQLKTGNYILKMETENGMRTHKFSKL